MDLTLHSYSPKRGGSGDFRKKLPSERTKIGGACCNSRASYWCGNGQFLLQLVTGNALENNHEWVAGLWKLFGMSQIAVCEMSTLAGVISLLFLPGWTQTCPSVSLRSHNCSISIMVVKHLKYIFLNWSQVNIMSPSLAPSSLPFAPSPSPLCVKEVLLYSSGYAVSFPFSFSTKTMYTRWQDRIE